VLSEPPPSVIEVGESTPSTLNVTTRASCGIRLFLQSKTKSMVLAATEHLVCVVTKLRHVDL